MIKYPNEMFQNVCRVVKSAVILKLNRIIFVLRVV